MIGLPTNTASRISSDDISGLGADLADQHADRLAHRLGHRLGARRIHHHVGDAAHQILAEADLRVRRAGGGERAAGKQRGEVAGDRRRADVDGEPAGEIVQARPERDHHRPAALVMHGGRHLPLALAQDLLHLREQVEVDARRLQPPLLGQDAQKAVGVAERLVHVGLVDLDVAELGDRIALDRARLGALPDDLAVDLHVLRDVDDEVALDRGGAGEAALLAELAALRDVARFGVGEGRQVVVAGGDLVLGELAFRHLDLAAPANAPPAADGFDIDAERARRIEHRRAERKPPPPPGGHEKDERVFAWGRSWCGGGSHHPTCPRRASRPPRRRPPAEAVASAAARAASPFACAELAAPALAGA